VKSLIPFLEYYLRPLPGFTLLQPSLDRLALLRWTRTGEPPAPRSVKVALLRRFAGPDRRALVETGTFFGDTLAMLRSDFGVLHSIEISPWLARSARRRFAEDPGVQIHEGDSGLLLEQVLRDLGQPAVLWLDGHYSGPLTTRGSTDTPLLREIDSALQHGTPEDVILIDDARLLGANPAYPTAGEVHRRILAARPDWDFVVEGDVLRAARRDVVRGQGTDTASSSGTTAAPGAGSSR
jgi:hypothetical protein